MMRSLLALLAGLAALPAAAPAQADPSTTYIRAGHLFDGQRMLGARTLVVTEGKIVKVGEALPVPAGAAVVDLSGRTVMPGLIDAHTHIALHAGDYDGQMLRETPEYRALYASVNARKTLEGGVTTIRDLGNEGSGFADVALRDAIANGLVPGPRILTAISPITATGAYRLVGYSPYLATPPLSVAADGPTEIRKAVRQHVADGADVIKIYMESFEKKPLRSDILTGAENYSREELQALVDEAHRAHVKVAAHTYSDEAAKLAVDVGVDSIEHGLYLSSDTFRGMAAKGITYVPTLMVYELWRDGKILAPVSPEKRAMLANTVKAHEETFRRALKSGVKIVFGTDTYELPGTNGQELERMVAAGMDPLAALRSATSGAADLLGVGGLTGRIAPGMAADIIAVDGDPLRDMAAIERIAFVMKGGVVAVPAR